MDTDRQRDLARLAVEQAERALLVAADQHYDITSGKCDCVVCMHVYGIRAAREALAKIEKEGK